MSGKLPGCFIPDSDSLAGHCTFKADLSELTIGLYSDLVYLAGQL